MALWVLTACVLFIGTLHIRNAVHDAAVDQVYAQTYCVLKVEADAQRDLIDSEERYDRNFAELQALDGQIARAKRARPVNEDMVFDLQLRRSGLEQSQKAIEQYEDSLGKIATANSPVQRGFYAQRGW